MSQGSDPGTERADRAGHENGLSGFVPGDRSAGAVDVPDLVVESVFSKLQTVGPERVRFDDIDAALDVLAVDLLDDRRIGQVEFVEAGIEVNAFAVEHGPHAAVTQKDPVGQRVEKAVLHPAIIVFRWGCVQGVEFPERPMYLGFGQ